MVIHDAKPQPVLEKKPTIVTDYSSKKPTKNEQKEAQSSLSLLKSKMRTTMQRTTTIDDRAFESVNPSTKSKPMVDQYSTAKRTNMTSMNKIDDPPAKTVSRPTLTQTKSITKVPVSTQNKSATRTPTTKYNTNAKQMDSSDEGTFDNFAATSKVNGINSRTTKAPVKVQTKPQVKSSFKGFGGNSEEDNGYASERQKVQINSFAKKPAPKVQAPVKQKQNVPVHNKSDDSESDGAVSLNEMPIRQAKGNFDIPSEPEEDMQLVKCPAGCGKSFRAEIVQRHAKICKKVFQQKRKAFNVAEQRQIDEIKEMQAENKYKKKPTKQAEKPKAKEGAIPKWKMQSAMLRNGLRGMRKDGDNGGGNVNAEEAAIVQKFNETQMMRCPHCNRTFSDEAGKRHLPFCEKKAKEAKLKGAPQKKTPTPVRKR